MFRFFVNPQDISGSEVQLSAEDAAHVRALRLRPAELFVVSDGAGTDYVCRLGESKPDSSHSVAEIVETCPSPGEPSVFCSVYIAFAKGDRLDYAVQKSVELGAGEIIIFKSARCISIPPDMGKKTERLQKIALETAKQCGRGRVPPVMAVGSLEEAVVKAVQADLPLFLYECEDKLHLKQALEQRSGVSSFSIVTGPEGGFEPFEADHARSAGMVAVTLGPRILRCETAPAAALSAIMYHTENL